MSTWVGQRLSTKLFLPPARRDLVARPHLIEKLEEGLSGKLTVISAPAGFGKTSLVTAWRQQGKMPVAWYSLDEEDNEPDIFADYLIGALQTVDEGLGTDSAALLQNSPTPPLKVFLTSLLNEISECETEFALAFDDYHVITEFGIHEAMSYLIERLPPQAHVLITTRSDPPFPLSRLRARGELKELRAVDLRFERTEAASFFNDVMKLDLPDDDIAALEEKTEGWITGLQFCALSLQGKENKSDFVKQFAGDERFILDYLLEEVLHRQPDNVQDFLLQTSVLHRLNGPLCNALTERADADETLEYLNRSNLFLIPLDGKNNWFRYHHLFADLLRFKFKQKQGDRVAEMQLKASRWCEENELLEEAISYSIAAEDWDRALNLIAPTAFKLISVARFERVKHWAESIPTAALESHPMVCYWYVPPLLYNEEFDKAEQYLQVIERCEAEEIKARLLSAVWSSRCYITIARGDLEGSLENSKKAFQFLQRDDVIQHGVAMHARLATSLLVGDMKASEAIVMEAFPLYRLARHFIFEVWGYMYLAFVQAMQGRLSESEATLHTAIAYAKENVPLRPDPLIYPHSFLCDIYRERDDMAKARIYLDEALTLIQTTGRESYIVVVAENLKCLALMLEATGEGKVADKLIEDALQRLKKYGNEVYADQLRALKALLNLRRGDLAAATRWADASGLTPDGELSYLRESAYTTYARWLIASGNPKDALSLLERLQSEAERGSRERVVVEILILKSLAHQAGGDEARAIEVLEQSLLRTEPESYVRSYTDEGEVMAKLLLQTLKQNGKRWESENPTFLRYIVKLNDAFGSSANMPATQKSKVENEALPWWYVNDPLSERELEVMQLVAQGFSNQEIGNKIFISAGTVKRHLSNIYQKLDVHSRVQAIELARKFQLI